MLVGIKKLRVMSDEQWLQVLVGDWTVSGVLTKLGVNAIDARVRAVVVEAASRLGIERSVKVVRHNYSVEQVRDAVADAICWSDALKTLGLSAHGSNHLTIKKLVAEHNIDISHFDVKAAYRRNKNEEHKIEEVLVANSTLHRSSLRRLVLKHKLVDYCCKKCDNKGKWQDEELNLQLDHIDGDPTNNQISNLRFLCPNCHSQTETFGRKKR